MKRCWQRDPKSRPAFAEVTQEIDSIMEYLQDETNVSDAQASITVKGEDDDDTVIEHTYFFGMPNDAIVLHTMPPETSRNYVNETVIHKPPKK